MDKSKYWKDMYISGSNAHTLELNKDKSVEKPIDLGINNSLLISVEKPIDFVNQNYEDQLELKIYDPFTQNDLDAYGSEIMSFINEHNVMHNGITERMSISLIQSIISLNALVFILRYKKNNKIMGFMVDIPFFVNKTGNVRNTLTTYLCVNKQIRDKGVAMMIIRKALIHAHSRGILCSYYLLPKPFSKSAIQLKRWMRPINIEGALSRGFEFDTHKKKGDRTNNRQKLKYAVRDLPKDVHCKQICTSEILEKTYKWIRKNTENTEYFMWLPSDIEQWKNWCSAFDTFFVNYKNAGGLISIQCKEIFIPDSGCISNISFIPFHMSEKTNDKSLNEDLHSFMYKCAMQYANSKKQDALFCLETGNMTQSVMEKNNAVLTQGCMYIDFYNTILDNYNPSNLFVPLL